MTRIKIHISKMKLPFYPSCEVKCGLQNRVSTKSCFKHMISKWSVCGVPNNEGVILKFSVY